MAARASAAAWFPDECVTTPRAASEGGQGEHSVGGSASFEGSAVLQVFTFEPKLVSEAAGEVFGGDGWGVADKAGDSGGSRMDIIDADSELGGSRRDHERSDWPLECLRL